MLNSSVRSAIRLRGVRHNNLKNFDLDLPLNRLIVITGLSGSGKSSLAFDTLFAEGQRRYIETFSPYARQFLDRMDKPQVDSIEGIPPAIAIEQTNAVRSTRSTVGTMTEICDYMKVLWPQVAQLHCRQCGQPVLKEPPQHVWAAATRQAAATDRQSQPEQSQSEVLVTFEVPLSEKLSLEESISLVARQGYQRLLIDGSVVRLDEAAARLSTNSVKGASNHSPDRLAVVQDRLRLAPSARARFVEACEQAYHFGKGKLALYPLKEGRAGAALRFSNRLHCAQCDLEYREPSTALFSFNHPLGACPTCRGFGRIISIDYDLALPDRSKTLAQGAVKPWQSGQSAECQQDLLRMCRRFGVPTDVPFEKLSRKWQDFVIEGEPGYGRDEQYQWPKAWYGLRGYFRWLESKAYKMHVRVLLSRYRSYSPCPACQGRRFQPEALLYRLDQGGHGFAASPASHGGLNLADFYRLPVRQALRVIEGLREGQLGAPKDPLTLALTEVGSRLGYLEQVGLGYLTLDRTTRSLSGGETERVNLTTCLGTRLVNTLFVLDEPSVGLHPRDTERLIRILNQLRDAGNTVVVVEHEASVMRAADQLIDLGPGHGATGGQVVFQGTFSEILECGTSLTGEYLSGRCQVEIPRRRPVELTPYSYPAAPRSTRPEDAAAFQEAMVSPALAPRLCTKLRLSGATLHNLKNLSLEIPLSRLVCVTGVSGSGKTTLIREVLLPALSARLKSELPAIKASDRLDPDPKEPDETGADDSGGSLASARLEGVETLARVVLVDQSILGKTPRSNPAVYIGAFDDIREFYAQSDSARRRGLNASAFSFNSAQGQCERCRGAGFEKIEMQFLSDVYIRCPDCNGRRYRSHILDIKLSPPRSTTPKKAGKGPASALSIADLLDSTVEEAIEFLNQFAGVRCAQRAAESLCLLRETGLGYLKLGQPINTLSGGESQRLKLVKHLAESLETDPGRTQPNGSLNQAAARESTARPGAAGTLFLFDEPTTGLHFDDVRVLLKVFQRLVEAGHSVVVIEHNLDVIKSADWIIDLGPEAGELGGRIVAEGTPEQVAQIDESHTGRALREVLPASARAGLASGQETPRDRNGKPRAAAGVSAKAASRNSRPGRNVGAAPGKKDHRV